MKKIALLLMVYLLLCSCDGRQEEGIEGSQSVTVSETSSARTEPVITETEFLSDTKTTDDRIFMKPIPSDEPFDIPDCSFYDDFWTESEERFYHKEVLEYAREICFADEQVKSELEEFIQSEIDSHPDVDEAEVRRTLVAGNKIDFLYGGGYDFDRDGEYEYLISLNYNPSMYVDSGFLVYIDGSEYKILGRCMANAAKVINAGEYRFLIINTLSGNTGYDFEIYSFENGMPEKVFDIEGSESYKFHNNVFYCERKFHGREYPFVLCSDGVFRQFACEEISREDFEAHVYRGKEFLDSLAENGEEILEIYTYGYNEYELYGYDFCYSIYGHNAVYETSRKQLSKPYEGHDIPEYFTEEQVYGADVHSIRGIVYTDQETGGGYTLYAAREKNKTFTLCAADENGITDSMEISDKDLNHLYNRYNDRDSSLYPRFYDIDVPFCFSLPREDATLTYDTYFIVDGKFRQGEWYLDGEKQDGIDYTMLTCFGNEGNEFVSYSAPGILWGGDMEQFIKRNFTFDRENLRFEGYSEPYPEPTGYAKIADEVFKKYGKFIGGLYDYSPETVGEQYGSDLWLYKYEKDGFRTKAEVMERLREFCTESLAEQFYSYYIISAVGDLKEIDGIIYHYDGPPNVYSIKYIDSAEENNGVITARVYSYIIPQDIPFIINPPMYAKIVQEDGVWKLDSFSEEK
ncbi:MAG: hypothetical protein J1E40_00760 [Oscillospiraceae bacterium]|nr:hypothetical protein [Oscillospiraceae bacterium]